MQDLAHDLEDERTARIIAEEAATANQRQADEALSDSHDLRQQLALLMQQLRSQHLTSSSQVSEAHVSGDDNQTGAHLSGHGRSWQIEASHVHTDTARLQVEQLSQQLAEQQQELMQLRAEQRKTATAQYADGLGDSPVAAVNSDASEAAAEAAELRDQLQVTKQQFEQLQSEHALLAEQRHQALAEQKRVFECQIEQLHSQLQHTDASSAQEHDSEVQSLNQLRQKLESELQSMAQQLQTQQREHRASTAQCETAEAQLAAVQTQLRQLQQDNETSRVLLETVQAQLMAAHEYPNQQASVEIADAHDAAETAQLATAHEELRQLQQGYEAVVAQHADEMAQLKAAHNIQLQQQLMTNSDELQTGNLSAPPQPPQHDGGSDAVQDEQHDQVAQQLVTQQAKTHDLEIQLRSAQADLVARQAQGQQQQTEIEEREAMLRQQLTAQQARSSELEAELSSAQQLLSAQASAQRHGESKAADPSSTAQADLAAVAHEPDQADSTAQPDQARYEADARQAQDADQPTTSEVQPRVPDQALLEVSAFQARLHSMMPQLPALHKLEQLSLEVSALCDGTVRIHGSSPFESDCHQCMCTSQSTL